GSQTLSCSPSECGVLEHRRRRQHISVRVSALRGKSVRSPMSVLSLLLNLLWIVFGGLWMAVGWVVAAIVMAITIIGLPWARAAFNIAIYTWLPFGSRALSLA